MLGKLGVIVPVRNQPGWTGLIIHELLYKTSNPCSKLIVDNASDDSRTVKMLQDADGQMGFEVLWNKENLGVSAAWNQGAYWAQNKGLTHLAILNNDLVLPHGWDEMLLEPLKEDGVFLSALSPLQSATFAPFCFMVKIKIFERVGYFSEEWKYGHEELDFMVRMHLAGVHWVNVNVGDNPNFYHAGLQSWQEMFPTEQELDEYGRISGAKFDKKWGHLGDIRDFFRKTVAAVGSNR